MYVCVHIRIWEREELLMKKKGSLLLTSSLPFLLFLLLLFFIYRSFVYKSFSFLFIFHRHTSLYKLSPNDRHAMSAVVVVCLWTFFFSFIFSVNKKKAEVSLSFISFVCSFYDITTTTFINNSGLYVYKLYSSTRLYILCFNEVSIHVYIFYTFIKLQLKETVDNEESFFFFCTRISQLLYKKKKRRRSISVERRHDLLSSIDVLFTIYMWKILFLSFL